MKIARNGVKLVRNGEIKIQYLAMNALGGTRRRQKDCLLLYKSIQKHAKVYTPNRKVRKLTFLLRIHTFAQQKLGECFYSHHF